MIALFLIACSEWHFIPLPDSPPFVETDTGFVDTAVFPPTAVCEVPPISTPMQIVMFDGSDSGDFSSTILTYNWELISAPPGSTAVLSNNERTANILPVLAGDYVVQLTVTNELGLSDTDTCTTTVSPLENLWIELYWSHSQEDMDLHLLRADVPFSYLDCYYQNCVGGLAWNNPGTQDDPYLDLDDIPGIGPENINIQVPSGTYWVAVHDYPGSWRTEPTTVTVNVYLNQSQVYSGTKIIVGEESFTYFAYINVNGEITPL